jgi:hypothetical protein
MRGNRGESVSRVEFEEVWQKTRLTLLLSRGLHCASGSGNYESR